jgi:hypothetical protein
MDICKIYEAGIYKPTLGRCCMSPVHEPATMPLPGPEFVGAMSAARRRKDNEI